MRYSGVILLTCCFCGCASVPDTGRTPRFIPQNLAATYSEVEVRAQLALASDASCRGRECEAVLTFQGDLLELAQRLDQAAQEIASDQGMTVPHFAVRVLPKVEQGTLSSAGGEIFVFDGLRAIGFEEAALAFLVAREMGHVIAQHHEDNSATSIAISAIATLFLPVVNLIRGAAAAIPATASLTATTTAASMAGSHILKAHYRADQLREADALALKIVAQAGWSIIEVQKALTAAEPRLRNEGWMAELLMSKARLDQVAAGPSWVAPATVAGARFPVAVP